MVQELETNTILLIEDDPGTALLVQEKLEEVGCHSACVTTGKAAMGWLAQNRPRLVLLDYSLPDVSGIELVEKLAAAPGGMPPFIVTTGMGDERVAVAMMKRGARDYLVKDASFLDSLPRVVEQALKQIAVERRLAEMEQALRDRENRLRTIFETSHAGIILVNPQGVITYANQRMADLFGCSLGELIGSTYPEHVHPDQRYAGDQKMRQLIAGEIDAVALERHYIRKDGSDFWGFLSGRRQEDEAGNLVSLVGVISDITERKLMEAERITLLERLNLATRAAGLGIWDWDVQRNELVWDDQMYELYGVRREDFPGAYESWLARVHPDDRAAGEEVSLQARRGETEYDTEFRIIRPDGAVRVIKAYGKVTRGESGNPLRMTGVNYDITEWKHAEQVLRESEARYRAIFEGVQDAIFVETPAGKILDANQRACEMYGYSREQFLGMPVARLVAPGSSLVLPRSLSGAGMLEHPIETANLRANGERFPVELSCSVQNVDGEPVMLVVVRDITERKRAEEALRESEARLRTLINAMPDIVCFKDGRGRWLEANEFDLKLFQLTGVDYRGKKDSELADFSQFYRDAFLTCEETDERAWQAGGASRGEETIPRQDGPPLVFDVIKVPTFTLGNQRQGLVVVGRDITDLKRAEQDLRTALVEKEVLLRELYHRTKNNMQVISALLNLEAARDENQALRKTLLDMDNRIRSMALVHQKLYQSQNLSSIDLKDYLSDLANLLLATYQVDPGRITLRLEAESVPVLIDSAVPCGLVINEILSNALKYAFPGGREGEIKIRLSRSAQGMIRLEIADNGVGVPPGVDIRHKDTLGVQIITGVAGRQLGAKVEVDTSHGVAWCIQFEDNRYRPRV